MAICVFINMTSLGVLLLIYPFVTAPICYTKSLCIFVGLLDVTDMLNKLTYLGMHRRACFCRVLPILC
jgi:hypothetical protein